MAGVEDTSAAKGKSPDIATQLKAQGLEFRASTDSSHYSLNIETQTSLRNTLNNEGSVLA
ncbi:hypothetical protein IB633_07790 [Francisella philomiragia]|uniref:Uncharacterized protein n=1 Tax=Francisella philomiragia subsp. philomiragia (strain ATCC 25017 / CCUG 19701 / FSC 153 / O\|nr:hypothetical protein [Francisella philomiragia]AJI47557.1 hypothetical protein BF30_1364 [Francisella philomiragia]AJI49274.1 hypothetical protein KU46_193 [Francisella philomiragia]MBK2020937.1 hypothetical protein [Francisella philomiragia]MBK2030966.1 hypothetical protein [Francisella philomiragia]MBK2263987.1 hypothetical protein [Francisella philomiragia]